MRRNFFAICMQILSLCALAQRNDSLRFDLEPVTVQASRSWHFQTGTIVSRADSGLLELNAARSLADALAMQGEIFIKTYGPGALASSSMRGGNANHTQVLFNGFNLLNPMYNQVDFSMIPAVFIDEMMMQYGSNGALNGTGAVGGAVILNNKNYFGEGLHGSLLGGAGSYNNYSGGLALNYGTAKFYASGKIYYQRSNNNFSYHDLSGAPMSMVNAAFENKALLQDFGYVAGRKDQLRMSVWLQEFNRGIPPALGSSDPKASRKDDTRRVSAEWKHQSGKWQRVLGSMLSNESIAYADINIPSQKSESYFAQNYVEHFYQSGNFEIQLSGIYYYAHAVSVAYPAVFVQ